MEWADAVEFALDVFLMEWNFYVAAFGMHHSMYTLVVDDKSNAYTSPNSNIAHRLSHNSPLCKSNCFPVFKQRANIDISINKDVFLPIFECKSRLKKTEYWEILPC